MWATDLLILVGVVGAAQLMRFSSLDAVVPLAPRSGDEATTIGYFAVSVALIAAWMWALGLGDSRSVRVIGGGWIEYRAVVTATFQLFGVVAIIALLARVEFARGYLLVAFPLGVVALLAGRWMWRQWLVRQRRAGRYVRRVLLVGSAASVAQTAAELGRRTDDGYAVVGSCLPALGGADGDTAAMLGRIDAAIGASGADTVVVTSSDDLPPETVKRLSWRLEAGSQHLVLSAGIADIAGPRIHVRPVAGLPLIHVETPRLSSGQLVVKRGMDLVLSAVGLVMITPLLLVLALIVKAGSSGPVLFRQTRIGRDGREFTMLKFRSMVVGAEDVLPTPPADGHGCGNDVLFKMRDDPRITPAGRWMRRFSLDELPQLYNVLRGDMSLVGPRPPLPSEVAQYDGHVHRRFMMKPGITGLWQVSGRSTLSWDETVRLDLSYVENYSVVGDLMILFRTVRAVALPGEQAW